MLYLTSEDVTLRYRLLCMHGFCQGFYFPLKSKFALIAFSPLKCLKNCKFPLLKKSPLKITPQFHNRKKLVTNNL